MILVAKNSRELDSDDKNGTDYVRNKFVPKAEEIFAGLPEIRDSRLYRQQFSTFEAYCRERWGMGKAYSHRLIAAAEVVSILSPIGDTIPQTESQARPLTRLEPEVQREVWRELVEVSSIQTISNWCEAARYSHTRAREHPARFKYALRCVFPPPPRAREHLLSRMTHCARWPSGFRPAPFVGMGSC